MRNVDRLNIPAEQPRGRTSLDDMVEVLNPTVREPWQKLKEYFVN